MNMDSINLMRAFAMDDLGKIEEALKAMEDVNIEVAGSSVLVYYLTSSQNSSLSPNQVISLLADCGVNLDAKDKRGTTALHYCVTPFIQMETKKLLDAVNTIIAKGANVNIQDDKGETPLHKAVKIFQGKHEDLVLIKTLLAAGANPDIKNEKGESVKDIVEQRHQNIAKRDDLPEAWDLKPLLGW